MCPHTLMVLSTHMVNVIGDDVENLVEEVAAPVENGST